MLAAVLLPRLVALFFPSETLVGKKAPPIDGMTYIHGTPVQLGQGRVTGIVSHKVFLKSFCKSQFPHKFINLFLILVPMVNNKLTDSWGG